MPVSLEANPQLLDAASMGRVTRRLAHEIAERHARNGSMVLAGVLTRGVPLAQRIAAVLRELDALQPSVAALDPANHRDDRPRLAERDGAGLLAIDGGAPPPIHGTTVIVVDDVLFTGRTLRASLDALMAHGRPAAVEVLTLIDRGHRELPMRATYVGKNVPTAPGDRVYVRFREVDGVDGAWLVRGAGA